MAKKHPANARNPKKHDEDEGEADAPKLNDSHSNKYKKRKKEPRAMKQDTNVVEPMSREEKRKNKKKKAEEDQEGPHGLPGQKHDTPDERDPLRIFFEMLYQQLPDNEIAAVWMMEWGLLPPDEARRVYDKNQSKNQQQMLESPVKEIGVKKTSKISAKQANEIDTGSVSKTKKRKVKEGILNNKDDVILSGSKTKKRKVKEGILNNKDDVILSEEKIKKNKVSS